jgi:hypothetical protein
MLAWDVLRQRREQLFPMLSVTLIATRAASKHAFSWLFTSFALFWSNCRPCLGPDVIDFARVTSIFCIHLYLYLYFHVSMFMDIRTYVSITAGFVLNQSVLAVDSTKAATTRHRVLRMTRDTTRAGTARVLSLHAPQGHTPDRQVAGAGWSRACCVLCVCVALMDVGLFLQLPLCPKIGAF